MDEIDEELAAILCACRDGKEVTRLIMRHATIVQYLVCRLAKDAPQSETGIRTLYASWADLTVERFNDRRSFPARKPH
jgi:hypothetical protein